MGGRDGQGGEDELNRDKLWDYKKGQFSSDLKSQSSESDDVSSSTETLNLTVSPSKKYIGKQINRNCYRNKKLLQLKVLQ